MERRRELAAMAPGTLLTVAVHTTWLLGTADSAHRTLGTVVETLRALRLRTLRAEMATLGGRVRNVLVLARDVDGGGVAGDDDGYGRTDSADSVESNGGGDFIKEALRALVERPGAGGGDRPKRRRVSDTNMQAAA